MSDTESKDQGGAAKAKPTLTPKPMPPELKAAVDAAWPLAKAHWSTFLLLSDPVHVPDDPSIAKIDLRTRQVSINGDVLMAHGLLGAMEGILAHEIGHHTRYPGSLVTQVKMAMVERAVLPDPNVSVLNLFQDMLINEHLGHQIAPQLHAVYRSFNVERKEPMPGHFSFFLSIYEELWQLPRGDLRGPDHAAFNAEYPDAQADAQRVARTLFNLAPNVYTQLLYFLSVLVKYFKQPEPGDAPEGHDHGPFACAHGEPSADDLADAVRVDAREREAVDRAVREGWIDATVGERITGDDTLKSRIVLLPGTGHSEQESMVPEAMAGLYRRLASKHLLTPPPVPVWGDALVPVTLDDWQPGEAVGGIDWLGTLSARGDLLGAVMPLVRERLADLDGQEQRVLMPRVELYLDTSGSMPDPTQELNAMTLAALILATGALRAGGWVRAVLYSDAADAMPDWSRSEHDLSRFLMRYRGGGTVFPFRVLADSVRAHRASPPSRVVISDSDFHHNVRAQARFVGELEAAARHSRPLVLLLLNPDPKECQRYTKLGARVVPVDDLDDFPAVAAGLTAALFPLRETPR
jgi:hypothetical protein